MRLSNKSTFSLVCFISILALAFAAMPAMAQTIEATWATDRDANGTADDPGWRVTLGGLEAADTVDVTYLDVNGTAIAGKGNQGGFDPVEASPATTTTGSIEAALGTQIAVQVVNTTDTVTYQRVTFPVAASGATLAATTLVRLPKLMKLATPMYYATFGDMVTVTFDFAAAVADTNGAPMAPLHVSDVSLSGKNWQFVSVSGSNMITYRSTHAAGAASESTTATLGATFAQPTDEPVADGVATILYDDRAPTVTADSVMIAAPSGFPTPADGVWNSVFILTFSASDTLGPPADTLGSGLSEDMPARIDTDTSKLNVGIVGLGTADDNADNTEYLVRITPKADRVTTAGEEVVITIVPMDKAGNMGLMRSTAGNSITVKLAQMDAPDNRAPDFGANTIQNITAQATVTAVNVTLPAAVDPDGNNITYTLTPTPLPAGLSFNAGTRVLSGTPSAMSAQATYTYTATDNGSPAMSASLTFMITVSAAPVTPPPVDLHETETATSSAAITIQPNSFVVVVRDKDAMNVGGIKFRDDVTVVEWGMMPDLERLFYTGNQGVILGNGGGGALILKESDAQDADHNRRVGSVGISEIMWGIDAGHLGDQTREKSGQWIELHNLNAMVADNADTADVNEADDGVAKVVLSWKTGRDITSDSAITGNLANPTLDVVTNFFNNRPGGPVWQVKGNSGDSVAGVDFKSMGRILPDKKSAYANADGARYDNRDGRNAGHWNASSSAYLTARTDTTPAVVYHFIGTPGRVNNATVDTQPHIRAGRTSVASNNIYINEVGNLSGSSKDWIELRNNSGGNINLRNYLISIVTDNNTDRAMIQFANNNNAQVAAGQVFLLLRTDPADDPNHPIAATGYNVDKSAEEQQPGTPNSTVRYKVFGGLDLPDDGKFILIVRRPDNHEGHRSGAHNDHGVAETGNADLDKVVDVAGWDDNVGRNGYPNAVSNTGLWPLHSFAGPFTDRNSFKVNTVHRRQYLTTNDGRSGVGAHENKNQDDRAAFRDVGWTGVGYRRNVATSAMHGGTPGYNNGELHGAGGTITSAVYISEIMYADARNGSLPQWIELRNSNNSVGANLHNWRLTIINHADAEEFEDGGWDGKAVASVLLRNLKIKPNGTVLITSRKGPRSEVHLPASDIFSLFPTHRGTFGMTNANSDVINTFGFRITLHANGHEGDRNKWQLVDDVGNLAAVNPNDRRGDNEQFDMPSWMWPNAVADDGSRSSVNRTNNKVNGLGAGNMASSWILSSEDGRSALVDYVYYGHTDDTSTPGQTVGSPLPVSLSFFRPTLEDGKVVIHWTTESELDNAGFNIYRSESRNGEFTKVNDQLIQGKGTTAERSTYKWVDTSAKPGVEYYYQIEDVSFAGERETLRTTKMKGLISAENKATLRWGELKEVQ